MKKTIKKYGQEFESSSALTPQFKDFWLCFNREFKKVLKELGAVEFKLNRGHFEVSGFFRLADDRIYYISLSDVRWFKGSMLIRTAKNFKDFSGGSNGSVKFDEDIKENLKNYLN